jgi:hypothetical protein
MPSHANLADNIRVVISRCLSNLPIFFLVSTWCPDNLVTLAVVLANINLDSEKSLLHCGNFQYFIRCRRPEIVDKKP